MTQATGTTLRARAPRWDAVPWPTLRWLGLLLAGVGYWGPWVQHPTAALTLLGIDLAEFVKFLPGRAAGWPREVFLLPVVGLSAALTLTAHGLRGHGRRLRWLMALAAIFLAPTLLPPAWSPASLRLPEYRAQLLAIAALVGLALVGPLLARLPGLVVRLAAVAIAIAGGILPTVAFAQVLPAIEATYRTAFAVGRGPWLMLGGWLLFGVASGFIRPGIHSRKTEMEESLS